MAALCATVLAAPLAAAGDTVGPDFNPLPEPGDSVPLSEQPPDGFEGGVLFDMAPPPWLALPIDIADDALLLFFAEVALLAELDAFDDMTSPLEKIRTHIRTPPGTRDERLSRLATVDQDLAATKLEMLSHLDAAEIPTPLDDLPLATIEALRDGEVGVVSGVLYTEALARTLTLGAEDSFEDPTLEFFLADMLRLLAPPGELAQYLGEAGPRPTAELPSEAPEAVTEPDTAAAARPVANAAPESGENLPVGVLAAAAAAAGLVTVVVALWLMRRRRRDDVAAAPLDLGATAEALRKLTTAADEVQVAAIAIAEGRRSVRASGGVVARPVAGNLRVVGRGDVFADSCLMRPATTGQVLRTTVGDDCALPGSRVEVLAVAAVADGEVTGVLAVWRPEGAPFTDGDAHQLAELAPNVGAALKNVDRLSSATNLAFVDGLTALGNRRRLDRDLDQVLRAGETEATPVAFAMIDVDHFKLYNDTHGHAAGDAALQEIGQVMAMNVRPEDVVYRYGGEEFSILLPGATIEEARHVAERVRSAVERADIEGEQSQPEGKLTVSVGVATSVVGAATPIRELADRALYGAKEQGRNCVVVS